MSRTLMYALAMPLLGAEIWAQFVARDQQWATAFAVLALGVLAVRCVLGPPTGEETCPPNCPKCSESESWEGEL